jgi:hypothetical protein
MGGWPGEFAASPEFVASFLGDGRRHLARVARRPRRQFIVHVEGEVEVEVSDGEVRRFSPGSVVLVEDTHGTGHITRPVGGMPRTTLFIALQEPDGPLG